MLLSDSVTSIPFIGEQKARLLLHLDIYTIKDLMYHIPVLYKDTSDIVPISRLDRNSINTVEVKVLEINSIRLRHGKSMQKATVTDQSGSLNVTWFNQPYLVNTLKSGTEALLSGKLNPRRLYPEMISPEYDILKVKNIHLGRIIPIYPLTAKISSKWLRSRLDWLIVNLNQIEDLNETIPHKILAKYKLVDIRSAIKWIHFPDNMKEISAARKRLGIDELVEIFIKLYDEREKRLSYSGPDIKIDEKTISNFVDSLEFKLTQSQRKAIREIMQDYQKPYPMERLLQGDVGSGKTVVAITAMLPVIESGYQAVLLAPTSILAKQHYQTLKKYLGSAYKVGLITSSTKDDIENLSKIDILVGTHAILYHKEQLITHLGLLIVDEEHRFGVNQRRDLVNFQNTQGTIHVLYLTATPIPRSIALSLFGQMDVSAIEKPPKRLQVKTHLVPNNKKKDAVKWLAGHLHSKAQIFWICPHIVDTEDDTESISVQKVYSEVVKLFPKFRAEYLHGKLNQDAKNNIIRNFTTKKTQILVSTTVVEVGIDIPGANIIVIEGPEKFGLAQLHQLRGRVGRRNQESWCLLFTSSNSTETALKRLAFFSKESDGRKIAEFDLAARGPGEVYGTIQSGIPNLKVAKFSNLDLIEESRKIATEIIKM